MAELKDIKAAQVDVAVSDLEAEDYEVEGRIQQPDGRFTIVYHEKSTSGLDLVPDKNDAIVPQAEVAQPAQPAAGGAQTLGAQGTRLVKSFEKCAKPAGPGQFQPYTDDVGVLTIGWGHTNRVGTDRFNAGDVWSQQQCDEVFLRDMSRFENSVRSLVNVPLNQDQFDAIVSFCYNCGQGNLAQSTLLRKVNARDFAGAAEEFKKWVKGGGRVLKGLVRRRGYEARLFRGIHDASFEGDPPSN